MRRKVATLLCLVIMLCGCSKSNGPLEKAISLRNRILESNGCSFSATVTADYGEKLYTFSMDCTTDKEGTVSFNVTKPETIGGIKGKISAQGGALTFDDKLLAFETLTDGEISPVTAPWIFIKTLRSGYMRGCTDENGGYQIVIDDSYEADALRLNIFVENNLPVSGEIFWKGRRVLSITVDNFTYL